MRAGGCEEDVLRLEVAVDDTLHVRRREAVGDRGADQHGLAPRRQPVGQARPQRLPLEQLHHGESWPSAAPSS